MKDLIEKLTQGVQIVALETPYSERSRLLREMAQWNPELPIYYWNPELNSLKTYTDQGLKSCCSSVKESGLLSAGKGIYLLESTLSTYAQMHWINLVHTIKPDEYVVLTDPVVELSVEMRSLIPLVLDSVPEPDEVEQFLATRFGISPTEKLVRACLGIHLGALERILDRAGEQDLAPFVTQEKQALLEAKGLEQMGTPDVEMGGLDNLEAVIDRASKLFTPAARAAGLPYPKGIILYGIPGTGKSLTTKHAAARMGFPLWSTDWGAIIDDSPAKAAANLRAVIQSVEAMAPAVLAWDDFEKMPLGPLLGMMLTWMQERTKPVYIIASVNRLEKLPPELIRPGRFDEIIFVTVPHEGARKDIFTLHLNRFVDRVEYADLDWHVLIQEYHLCTAAEIAGAVQRAAANALCEGRPGVITFDDLMAERKNFEPSMIREEENLLKILKGGVSLRPACSPDRSRWKVPPAEMFSFLKEA